MKKPSIQNAISLNRFVVEKCDYECLSSFELRNIEIDFRYTVEFSDSENQFCTKFIIEFTSKENEEFYLTVYAQALFSTEIKIDDEFKASGFANANAPAIAFPFLRSFIQTFCVNAGIRPIILPSFNFARPVQEDPDSNKTN